MSRHRASSKHLLLLLTAILCVLSPLASAGAVDRRDPAAAADASDAPPATDKTAKRWHWASNLRPLGIAHRSPAQHGSVVRRNQLPTTPAARQHRRYRSAAAGTEGMTGIKDRRNETSDGSDRPRCIRADATKVMVVGDSISQGREGDWTWRYRIWQWFQKEGISMRFVGPYTGTVPPESPSPPEPPTWTGDSPAAPDPPRTTGGYAWGADVGFTSNSDHFAVWGRAAAVDKQLIRDVVQQDTPDLVLLMLGYNDMGWYYSDWQGTIASVKDIVDQVRLVNPAVKFAIANVPQRLRLAGREDLVNNINAYNFHLPGAISGWSTYQSPVYLVDIAKYYACNADACPGGYDGLHPNALGEYQIAHAFSRTLNENFNLGSGPLLMPSANDPSLVRDLPVPSNFRVFSSPQGVTATWDPVYGAYSYDLQVSINGGGSGFSATSSQSNRWDSHWPVDGWDYAVSVRASSGDSRTGQYTLASSAKARPELPPPPQNIRVETSDAPSSGVTVSWDPPAGRFTEGILGYNVLVWDWEPRDGQYITGAAFRQSPARIPWLKDGTNYQISVVTWNHHGEGLPGRAPNVVPGKSKPTQPTGLTVDTIDATSVRLTWFGSADSAGYRVWFRNVNAFGSQPEVIANVTGQTCSEQYFLYPGVWNYAFSVSSFNGDEQSRTVPEVVAASPTGTARQDLKCPAPQP